MIEKICQPDNQFYDVKVLHYHLEAHIITMKDSSIMIMRQTATHNIQEKSKDLRDLPDHEVQDLDNHHITKSYIFHLY
jgi:hypothetical protein